METPEFDETCDLFRRFWEENASKDNAPKEYKLKVVRSIRELMVNAALHTCDEIESEIINSKNPG